LGAHVRAVVLESPKCDGNRTGEVCTACEIARGANTVEDFDFKFSDTYTELEGGARGKIKRSLRKVFSEILVLYLFILPALQDISPCLR
jgi:hypothetical protein